MLASRRSDGTVGTFQHPKTIETIGTCALSSETKKASALKYYDSKEHALVKVMVEVNTEILLRPSMLLDSQSDICRKLSQLAKDKDFKEVESSKKLGKCCPSFVVFFLPSLLLCDLMYHRSLRR